MDTERQIDRRGKPMWYAYAACVALFPVAAYFYGPMGLLIGIIGTALGVERIAATWDSGRRRWSIAFMIWVGIGAVAMIVPIWGHEGSHEKDGSTALTHHEHHLWERDHVH